jgi:hypothetical protein
MMRQFRAACHARLVIGNPGDLAESPEGVDDGAVGVGRRERVGSGDSGRESALKFGKEAARGVCRQARLPRSGEDQASAAGDGSW